MARAFPRAEGALGIDSGTGRRRGGLDFKVRPYNPAQEADVLLGNEPIKCRRFAADPAGGSISPQTGWSLDYTAPCGHTVSLHPAVGQRSGASPPIRLGSVTSVREL